MGEYRKELVKSAFVAIMSASLMGALTYYLVQPEHSPVPVVFALGEAEQFSGNYSTLEGYCLILQFTFLNRSSIKKSPLPSHEEMCQGILAHDEYSGELDAKELQRITLSVYGIGTAFYDADRVVRYLAACLKDRIINVTLADQDQGMKDLGSSKHLGFISGMQSGDLGDPNQTYYDRLLDELMTSFNVTRRESSSTGYWAATDYVWSITTSELADMLQESGPTTVTFSVDIDMELKYMYIKTSEENLTGSTNLSWSGTWGTLQLTHVEGKITWIKYKFETVKLVMIPTE